MNQLEQDNYYTKYGDEIIYVLRILLGRVFYLSYSQRHNIVTMKQDTLENLEKEGYVFDNTLDEFMYDLEDIKIN